MPATEKTWRDQRIMHVIFGLTGLIMLISTVWMFAADHRREWKQYQRKMRSIDVRFTGWRMAAEQSQEQHEKQQQLEAELADATAAIPEQSLIDQFIELVDDEGDKTLIRDLYTLLVNSEGDQSEKQSLRSDLMEEMTRILDLARFQENTLLRQRKFSAADYDERRANYDLAVRDNKSPAIREDLQTIVNEARQARDDLTVDYQSASTHRIQLQSIYSQVNDDVTRLHKELDDSKAEYDRLAASLDERQATYFTSRPPFLGKRLLEAPIVDAFNSPLKIDNLWTDNLTIENGSFGTVRRFDRCTTCHRSIDSTAPGTAVDPLYPHAHEIALQLTLPESEPQPEADAEGNEEPLTLLSLYGFKLASEGLVLASDVTVQQVLPGSPAASLRRVSNGQSIDGLQVGDVILYINGDKTLSPSDVGRALLDNAPWGETVELTIRRGLPHPYSSHPRLDLFVGSLSPHPVSMFGCSICHEGQGSATQFKWASHAPNDDEQMNAWSREHGWFNNHHWIFPMYPKRFAESSCLKCHHDVAELGMTDRFGQPPAPKLTHGFNLVREYGCFGCHEINGYEGGQRIGPDMRLEPNYFAGAAQIKNDPKFSELFQEQQSWVNQIIFNPERDEVRHQLLQFLKDDEFSEQPVLSQESHKQIALLSDIDNPGTLRRVGPSLRHIAGKVGAQWLYEWIKDPTNYRPSTRMPRFFGHLDHLDEGELETSKQYEPIEILGLVTYLMHRSQPQEFLSPNEEVTASSEAEQIERGKVMFETRGCLACHQHDEFSFGTATQGPDLSNIGDKFATAGTPDPQRWMYTWLRNPNLYHARTKMPDLYLEVIEHPDGTKTDAAADIAAFLLSSRKGWHPSSATNDVLSIEEGDEREAHLDGLLLEYLKTKMTSRDAEATIKEGKVPDRVAPNLTGAEAELLGDLTTEKKLLYIGNKTVIKYGCHGCHDMPGFEDAKPIGTALADWGRKDPSKIAFEHIAEYLHHGHGHHAAHGADHEQDTHASDDHVTAEVAMAGEIDENASQVPSDHPAADDESYESFYHTRLFEHDRAGFIWQKLKEPRSYDFRKARNKDSYNDRLRMPLFPLDNADREAVITFVLGLVADPPAHEFVYHPDENRKALIAGNAVLEKYNCVGCHIIDPEQWAIEFEPGMFEDQGANPAESFPFMLPHFTSDEIQASMKVDPVRGTVRATIEGMPTIDRDGLVVVYDDYGDPVEEGYEYDPLTLLHSFDLWKPTLLEGNPYQVGYNPLEIPATMITSIKPAHGGDLTRWLIPRVTELEREVEPAADGKQAYGWLPPPLIGQGNKVQSDWLHEFLLNPYMIRPATVMRMPRFNMSPEEATDLTRFFAIKDGTNYPYEYNQSTEASRLDVANQQYLSNHPGSSGSDETTRLSDAMNIITSNDYCVKCHLVADYDPGGSLRAKAPDLAVVFRRLRPGYMRQWIARPPQLVPYTPMPINIQFNANDPNLGGVSQDLYHGTSIEQVDALVDLLLNYPRYANQRAKVADLVKPVEANAAAELPAAGD